VLTDFSYAYSYGTGPVKDGTLTTSYGYDTLNRLTTATEKNGGGGTTASWNYGYDNAGNRTGATINGATNPISVQRHHARRHERGAVEGWSPGVVPRQRGRREPDRPQAIHRELRVGAAGSMAPAAMNACRSVLEIRTYLPILWKRILRSAISRRTNRTGVPSSAAAS